MALEFGERNPRLTVAGRELRGRVVNEREVRAAAGLTMVLGAVAFSYAYFMKQYVPLQVVASLFLVEFVLRVTVGIRYSPAGALARAMTLGQPAEWVSAKPKRFAWTLGLAMALAMTVITNTGIRGYLPRTMCLICLTLMWMESALGLCLGCKVYGLLLRRGWIGADPAIEVCADGSCEAQPARSSTRFGVTAILTLGLTLGALLVAAAPAAAGRLDTRPLRSWSVLKMNQAGEVKVAGSTQRGGLLKKTIDIGPAAFILEPILAPVNAIADVLSTADGKNYHVLAQAPVKSPSDPQSAMGSVTHLDEYQTYRKRAGDASLSITISRLLVEAVDDNGGLTDAECPERPCFPIVAEVQFHARAYESGFGQFFGVSGVAYLQGSAEKWELRAGSSPFGVTDSVESLWSPEDFTRSGTGTSSDNVQHIAIQLKSPRTITVPLFPVKKGKLFVVHVSLDAEAADDRGSESSAQAFIEDPQHRDPPLLRTHGLQALGKPPIKEPALTLSPAAQCSGGSSRKAGVIGFSTPTFFTGEGNRTALVQVTRTGGSRGAASVDVSTTGGSAQAGSDFTSTSTRVLFGNRDASPRLVEIPIRQDGAAESPEKFTVALSHARCGKLGAQRSAVVTIDDDDQSPLPPAPEFTIGGTVDGLQGSGLVLTDLGGDLAVTGNGRFTLPGTVSDGQTYEVNVKAQPHNPDQVCTVDHGAGHVGGANVTNIAVHCAVLTTPSGLDTTFGSNGRVSTPVGDIGQGEAVVIQPDGGIVTAGSRQIGTASDFALTRNNPDGTLDTSFGTGGIAVTDLGGKEDKALDAALTPDGGIVAVGEADPAGFLKGDFGIVRYNPDGTLNTNFGTGGIVTTDFRGDADQAEAVAVQPDGKIVVAGLAATVAGGITDFALARYNADGTLDQSFGSHGIVTTDISGDDAAVALGIQADGKITLVGTAGEHIALARYTPDGNLDLSFGTNGTAIYPGFGEARGLFVTPNGGIFIAGDSGGDFLLLSYRSDGTLNPGFGNAGTVTTDISGSGDFAENLVIDAQGRIIVVGRAASPTILDMALARYNPDGTLDTSFAAGGILTADFHGRGEFGEDVALDSTGRLVAAGYTANGGDTEFALMRANP